MASSKIRDRTERGSRTSFTLPQLAQLSGVDYRTLHNWLSRGLLSASQVQANGSGTTNLFGPGDAFQACVLADLRRSGFELDGLERAADQLQRVGESAMNSEYLLIADDLKLIDDPADLGKHLSGSSPALIYRTRTVRELVERAVSE